MLILGLNAYHPDASAVLLQDGKLIAAVEEERLRRIKHWTGFPTEAIRSCLAMAGARAGDIDRIAIGRNPRAHLARRMSFAARRALRPRFLADRLKHRQAVASVPAPLADALAIAPRDLPRIDWVEHHTAHLASAFFASPYDDAAVCALDALGDFVSTSTAIGTGNTIAGTRRVFFPHSLGILYSAVTQCLGFPEYGDEFKVMGLAAFGRPVHADLIRRLVQTRADGGFELELEFFEHARGNFQWTWREGAPSVSRLYSARMVELLGPVRAPAEPVSDRHADLAASLQAVYEDVAFHVLGALAARTSSQCLCLAGGCAFNSVANGKVTERTPFREVFVQPAAGDSGTALGAALHVHHETLKQPRGFIMRHAAFGPSHDTSPRAAPDDVTHETFDDDAALIASVAAQLAAGLVVGWYQDRMEWGPRALGNRSILADPRRAEMRDYLNRKIKYREPFRPFAMSIAAEAAAAFIEAPVTDRFMAAVRPVKEAMRASIPAVVHADGTSRIQVVDRDELPRFHALITAFGALTGVPLLLNTSFNESEPIVDTPQQAFDCFVRTGMDVLVIGKTAYTRTAVAVE